MASTRCERQFSVAGSQFLVSMRSFSTAVFAVIILAGLSLAQTNSGPSGATAKSSVSGSIISASTNSGSTIALRAISTVNVPSEMGGAFMSSSKCDSDGNLYIRKFATDRPMLGPVVKIDADSKRIALFDPAAFSQLALDRADAFSPAADGGLYQIAQSGVLKPRIYVLHFSSDGSPSSPTHLDADFEVYTFAAFVDGNFLVSGVKRDVQNKDDRGHNFTAVFSADGRQLAELSFQEAQKPATTGTKSDMAGGQKEALQKQLDPGVKKDADKSPPTLDLADAEVGSDGNLYVMRRSSPALVYVIAPSGKITQTLKVSGPRTGSAPSAFHVSGNQMAISFWNEEAQSQTMVIADAQTGRKIASYSASSDLGPSFACFSANEGVFTFLKLGEGNALEVIRATPQ